MHKLISKRFAQLIYFSGIHRLLCAVQDRLVYWLRDYWKKSHLIVLGEKKIQPSGDLFYLSIERSFSIYRVSTRLFNQSGISCCGCRPARTETSVSRLSRPALPFPDNAPKCRKRFWLIQRC